MVDAYPNIDDFVARSPGKKAAPHDQTVLRAAQYLRKSTEHQKYSTTNQAEAIKQYADERGIEVVRTYADEGRSGLDFNGRDSLQKLLADVVSGSADYSLILVYDVSRWGRFQDTDESAHYEYLCKRSGIHIRYCAEQFKNDGSFTSDLAKMMKRKMAAEYSRELSAKVFYAKYRMAERGWRQGGQAGYGFRRLLVGGDGVSKDWLAKGQRKNLQTDHVLLVPGPDHELETVRWIYETFVEVTNSEREIADMLNGKKVPSGFGHPWTRFNVCQVLNNEKYIGDNIWNKRSSKLKSKIVRNRPELWAKTERAFEPIVDRQLFFAAQKIIRDRSIKATDDEMLLGLRQLLEENGHLSRKLIDAAPGLESGRTYEHRFGGLCRAYSLVGFVPARDYRYMRSMRGLWAMRTKLMNEIVGRVEAGGGSVGTDQTKSRLLINKEFTIVIVFVRCAVKENGESEWSVYFRAKMDADLTIAVRLDQSAKSILDYYLFPCLDVETVRIRLGEFNSVSRDCYRSKDLEPLYALAARTNIPSQQ